MAKEAGHREASTIKDEPVVESTELWQLQQWYLLHHFSFINFSNSLITKAIILYDLISFHPFRNIQTIVKQTWICENRWAVFTLIKNIDKPGTIFCYVYGEFRKNRTSFSPWVEGKRCAKNLSILSLFSC